MNVRISPLNRPKFDFNAPGDKSITHRAVMLAGAAQSGFSRISGALLGEDCLATVSCMRALGAEINMGGVITVAPAAVFRTPAAPFDCGNSGTTMRLLAGLLAGREAAVTLTGDGSLCSRPMGRVTAPLIKMGADITSDDGRAPLVIKPAPLTGISYEMPVASAQVKSALLLAGLAASSAVTVVEREPTRDHTEIMLTAMGAKVERVDNAVTVYPGRLNAVDISVPGDISSAAYLLTLAAVSGGGAAVKNCGLNPTRTGILEVFKAAGINFKAEPEILTGEPCGAIEVRGGDLRPFKIGGALIPRLIDEIPLIAALACFAEGESEISGAEELKVKESNRIKTTAAALRALGADITETAGGFIIRGKGYLEGGGMVDAAGDHRIAMAAAVAGAASKKGCVINGAEIVNVSFPGFFELLERGK